MAVAGLLAGTTGGIAAAASDQSLSKAKAAVKKLEQPQKFPALPSAPKPQAGKKIFIISVDQSLEGIARITTGVEDAAKLAGWTIVVIDGKSSPDNVTAGLQRAKSEGADGIVLEAFNSSYVQPEIDDVHAAGIPIVSVTSGSPVSNKGVAAEIGTVDYNKALGTAEGQFAIADSNANAKAIVFNDTSFVTAPPIADGAVAALKKCKRCKVLDKIDFTGADIVTSMSEKVRTALSQNPDANYIIVPYDFAATYAVQGVREAGKASDVKVLSTGGNLANIDAIRKGDAQVMTVAEPLEYFGYLAVDTLNRILQKSAAIPFNAPMKILVKSNLPPQGSPWTGDSSVAATFKKSWGS